MEQSIMPYEAVKKVGDGCVLVLAPHPDDEVFGCGGAIMRHLEANDELHVVVVSDGGYLESGSTAEYIQLRRQESIRAGELLGYVPKFWDIRDREVCYGEALICRIIEALDACDIDVVYVPSVMEMHPDHRSLGMAAAEAVRRSEREITVVFYEVGIPLHPNCLLDISDLVTKKQAAMACFESQLQQQPYDEQIAALNRFRSYTLPDSVRAAEAYFLISGEKLRENPLSIYHSEAEKIRFPGLALEAQHCDLVTVMIRSMGREKLLQEALDSVALQTYPRIEVLVVNAKGEGHPDMGEWCGRFPLRMCGTGEPLPRSRAANMGLENAKGEYLIFLDDDDLFDPDHITNLFRALKDGSGALVAYAGVATIGGTGSCALEIYNFPFYALRLLASNYIPIHAVLFHRSLLDVNCHFDESFDLYEDWDFWLQASEHSTFIHVNKVSAKYRIMNNANSGVQEGNQRTATARFAIYKKWKSRWSDDDIMGLMQLIYEKFTLDHDYAKLIAGHDQLMVGCDQLMAERDELIAGQVRLMGEIDELIAGQVRLMDEREELIAGQVRLMDEREELIAGQDHVVEEKMQLEKEYEAVHTELDQALQRSGLLEQEMNQIRASHSWRMTSLLRGLRRVLQYRSVF